MDTMNDFMRQAAEKTAEEVLKEKEPVIISTKTLLYTITEFDNGVYNVNKKITGFNGLELSGMINYIVQDLKLTIKHE